MPVNLISSGGGTTTLTPAASASNFTVTLPASTTTMVGTDATQTLTSKTLSGATWTSPAGSTITSGTVVASTSGTNIDFTGIPSWVKRITVMFFDVSTNSSSKYQLQIGTSSGIHTTGYVSGASNDSSSSTITTGFLLNDDPPNSSTAFYGIYTICLLNSANGTWSGGGNTRTTSSAQYCSGGKSLSGVLDRIRITTINGTDIFDAGSINILYE
jgi:hypothetical protein